MNRPELSWGKPRRAEELYDLRQDPHEQVNLIDDPRAEGALADLRAQLDAHMAETSDPFLGRPFEVLGSEGTR